MKSRLLVTAACVLGAVVCFFGCRTEQAKEPNTAISGGDPRQGQMIIRAYNCGACHIIPGVPNANGLVGPPLNFWARRTFIAGEFPNTPPNLVRWIMSPPSMEPRNAMPNLGISEPEARAVAAYLYTLR